MAAPFFAKHDHMKIFRNIIALFFFALVAILVGMIVVNSPARNKTEFSKPSSLSPLSIQGLVYSSYNGSHLLSRTKAEQLQVRAKRYSLFKVKSVNEAIFVNPVFESYLTSEDDSSDGAGQDFNSQVSEGISGLAELKGVGHIVSALLLRPVFILDRGAHDRIEISAKQGEISLRNNKLVLTEVVFEGTNPHRLIQCQQAIWEKDKRQFYIPGEYRLEEGRRLEKGGNVFVGLDISVKPNLEEKP